MSGYRANRAADVMLRRAQAFHLLRLGVCVFVSMCVWVWVCVGVRYGVFRDKHTPTYAYSL